MQIFSDFKDQPRQVWALFFSTLVNRIGTMALPFLLLYLTEEKRLPMDEAGWVFASYGFGALLIGPFSGWLCDHWGAYQCILFSLVVSAGFVALYPFVHGLPAIWVMTLGWSMSSEIFRPASFSFAGTYAIPEKRKSVFALLRLGINLGMSIGPVLGAFLAAYSYRSLFLVDAVTTLLAAWLFVRYLKTHKKSRSEKEPGLEKVSYSLLTAGRVVLSDIRMRWILLGSVPLAMVFFQHNSTLSVFVTRELGLSKEVYGLVFSINTALIILIEVPLNYAMRAWKVRSSFTIGGLLTALGFGILFWVHGPIGLVISVVIWTFGEMIIFPALLAFVSEISPEEQRGSYMSFFLMSFNLGWVFGPSLGAILMETQGARMLWLATATTGFLSVLILSRVK